MTPGAPICEVLRRAASSELPVTHVQIGMTWTQLDTAEGTGLAMTPGNPGRSLPWSGTLRGRPLSELQDWFGRWHLLECAVGLAAVNAALNASSDLPAQATILDNAPAGQANLSVFHHFLPRLKDARVVVVGQYPGLDQIRHSADLVVLERLDLPGTVPDTAAPYLLPEADWVFLTGTSLINQSFEVLSNLAYKATLVLMGPSVPWFDGFADYGVDILAGTVIRNHEAVSATVAEGGGTRLFDEGVRYALLDLHASTQDRYKAAIAHTVASRDALKTQLSQATDRATQRLILSRLDETDARLSQLDSAFDHAWREAGCPAVEPVSIRSTQP